MPRRMYSGSAQKTVLTNGIDASATAITIDDASGYPSGASGNFWIVIDRGLSNEEKILCSGTSGNTINAVDRTVPANRDDTINQSHSPGAEVEHCYTADDADDANRHIFETTDDDHTQYFNSTRHDAHPHATATLEDDSVTGDKIEPAQRWESGDLKWSARATPTSGWLLCDGSAKSRTTFADLFSAIGTDYGAGDGSTTFNVPDYRDRVALGVSGSKARGASGGSANAVAVSHNHTQNSHNHTQDSHTHVHNSHNHNQTAHDHPQNSHLHSMNGQQTTANNQDHQHSTATGTDSVNHTHRRDGSGAGEFASAPAGGNLAFNNTQTQSQDATHDHTLVGNIQSETANNIAVVANLENGVGSDQPRTATNVAFTATNQSAGVSGTGANLPPYQAANCFIKT